MSVDSERRVLAFLREHPHDDTPQGVARRLGLAEPDVDAAFRSLHRESLLSHARGHWQLTRLGWEISRRLAGPANAGVGGMGHGAVGYESTVPASGLVEEDPPTA
jgi:hypothetical protein